MSATRESVRRLNITLAKTVKLLSRGKHFTAAEIARCMKCSRVSAYERVCVLEERGCKIKRVIMPREPGKCGPNVIGFILIENRASGKVLEAVR
jgi:hypothetical protein